MDATTLPTRHPNQHAPTVTRAKQAAYLKALSETGIHGQACKYADIAENVPFGWANKSSDFAKRREIAQSKGESLLLSKYETTLDENVLGVDNLQDFVRTQVIRMFRMKRLDPRYRDNAVVEVNMAGPVAIAFGIDNQATQPIDITRGHTPKAGA